MLTETCGSFLNMLVVDTAEKAERWLDALWMWDLDTSMSSMPDRENEWLCRLKYRQFTSILVVNEP